MAKKKRGGDDHGGGGGGGHDGGGGLRWLLTYTDMVTLLLALFIVMWASADSNQEKQEQIQAAFAIAFGYGQPSMLASGGSEGSKPIVMERSQLQFTEIKDKMKKHLLEHRLDEAVNVHLNERGLLIRVYADKVRFDKGSSQLDERYKKVLDQVARLLEVIPNPVQVNGYTDNQGGGSGDNWTLSAMRAVNTVRYLETKNIAPERMAAVGYGPYSPLVPNSDEVRRWMNRRIDIQVLKAPIMKELMDSGTVRQQFNPEVAPVSPPSLSPAEGVEPKPLTF